MADDARRAEGEKRSTRPCDCKVGAGEAHALQDGRAVAAEVHGGAAGLTEAGRTWPFRGQAAELVKATTCRCGGTRSGCGRNYNSGNAIPCGYRGEFESREIIEKEEEGKEAAGEGRQQVTT